MSQHELNKQKNRERILQAADEIVCTKGIDALSMRYLAEYAGVSLRTPYNLFGSKTSILAELLLKAFPAFVLLPAHEQNEDQPCYSLEQLLHSIHSTIPHLTDKMRQLFWCIMISDEQNQREKGIALTRSVIQAALENASECRQLPSGTDIHQLAQHLAVAVLATLGMWAGQQITAAYAAEHIAVTWQAMLLKAGYTGDA